MLHVRDTALRFWSSLPYVRPLGSCVITEDLLLVWHTKLAAPLSTRQYKIRTLGAPALTDDLAAFPPPHIAEWRLLQGPLLANVNFDAFCPSCNIVGKHFLVRVTAQSELPRITREGPTRYEPKRTGERLPVPAAEFLWDAILVVLQPPLDLSLSRIVDLPHDLYEFQVPGIEFLAKTQPGALLGDDMGLGKTVQAIVALRVLFQAGRIRHALVVCPRSVLRQWERHFEEWAPLLVVTTVDGDRYVRQGCWIGYAKAHVYLMTYGIMRQDIQLITRRAENNPRLRFDVVVLDEISNIKNPGTRQSQAAKALPKRVGWGLSGTPLENRPGDVVAEFDFLHPELFAGRTDLSNSQVRDRIAPYFMRRRKSEVLKDLPALTHTEHWLELTSQQQDSYEKAYETGVVELREKGEQVTVTHIFALLTKLKQICNVDPRTRKSGKLKWLQENLEQMASDNDKVLIFSQWLESGVDEIYQHLPEERTLRYVGEMSSAKREAVVERFRSDPDKNVLLLTYGSGGHGLNLQAANYVILFDHWWNPATEKQAVDRTHRIGQTKPVFVYDLWIKNTVEEKIYQILEDKQQLFAEVIDSLAVGGAERTGLSEEDLFGLFDLTPPRSEREKKKPTVQYLLALTPDQFEELLARIYRQTGYDVRVTPATRDQGIDVIAHKQDALNPECIAIQCKNHRAPIGRPDAQRFLGAVTDPKYSQAILVATAGFTHDCEEFARKQGRLKLVDGQHLCDLMQDLEISLRTEELSS